MIKYLIKMFQKPVLAVTFICAFLLLIYSRRLRENDIGGQTEAESPQICERRVRLADQDELKIIFLNSFPGSGNT